MLLKQSDTVQDSLEASKSF